MAPETVALIISGLSLLVAGTSLGWNVYRDVILKPRLRITFGISQIVGIAGPVGTFVSISAVNHGPGSVTCNTIATKESSLFKKISKKVKWGIIIHDWTNPLSGKLPHRLEIGETITLLFPYSRECFLKDSFTHIGICDSFGRTHWASKSSVIKARKQYSKEHSLAS